MSVLQNNKKIEHEGVISSISNDSIFVRIIQAPACAECHAKNACKISGSNEKIIEIPRITSGYKTGDKVIIRGDSSIGLKAVLYAFVIPLILIVISLSIILNVSNSETFAALISVIILVIYYFILYLFREKFKKKFVFTLTKKI